MFLRPLQAVTSEEQHPDLAPRERQAEAEKNFVKLSTEFDEASCSFPPLNVHRHSPELLQCAGSQAP